MIFSLARIISELSAGMTLELATSSHPARLTVSASTAGPQGHCTPETWPR
jgi:hypothetical protein